ncbi:MAG: tetratricopeptide repeat protein [Actinomycetota bacterium]
MRRLIALGAVAVTVVAATYVVQALNRPSGVSSPTAARIQGISTVPGLPASSEGSGRQKEVDRLIGVFEAQVRRQPSTLDLNFLGSLYIQRGRLTGDLRTYAQADEALSRALEISPQDVDTRSLLASVRFTTHDFAAALRLSEDLLQENPENLGALTISADSRLELGDYGRASSMYSDLARTLPDVAPVQVRQARLAYLVGDVGRAVYLAQLAESSAATAGLDGPDLAWYRSFRAQLELDGGRYAVAAELYRSALRAAPDSHVAIAGLGKAQAALGRIERAIKLYGRAIELVPDPSYLSALGDLYAIVGDADRSQAQYDTVEVVSSLARINRQAYNRQLVVFYGDHDFHLRRALELARAELAVRKDVYGWDAYAWVLYRLGRFSEARAAADEALRIGTADARLLYHSGMISMALGEKERAVEQLLSAIDISPRFDPLQAEVARDALESLQAD